MLKILLVLIFLAGVAALTPRPKHIPRYIFGRPYGGMVNRINFSFREDTAAPFDCKESSYFERYVHQPIDHFSSNSTYWPQFYQYNRKFYNSSTSLAFFILGGEAPIDTKWACKDDVPYLKWAKKYGAAVFQAEHRYFGRSRPTESLTVANLKWLTPEQTLADYNNFIKEMNKRYFGKQKMRWVLFGASYAGTLTAWMRVAYPNASIAGITTSAAVNLQVDNYGFAINMQKSYTRTDDICAKNINAAFKKIQSMSYSKTGRDKLENIFNLCTKFPSSLRPKDLQYFWANLFVEFQSLNQYSNNNHKNNETNNFGMPTACAIMNNASEPDLVVRVRNVLLWTRSLDGEEGFCMPNNYEEYITILANTTYDETGDTAAGHGWLYQCCSYLGYFTTTDGGYNSGVWGSMIPLDFAINQCRDIFGRQFKFQFVNAQVKKYRDMFGGAKHYKGSKIVFTNGNMDPWLSLGLLESDENPENQVFATTIDGETHCSDMYPARGEDSVSLKTARAFTASKLDFFIRST